jgi:uncharacterized protein YceH (UPF0502 family)
MLDEILLTFRKITMDANEKRQRFVKLAEGRTQEALNAIRKIGNLSNKRAYEYTEADVRKMVKALRDAVSDIERKLDSSGPEPTSSFKL